MGLDEELGQSGVRYRCSCGEMSDWQRIAKLPPHWSLRFLIEKIKKGTRSVPVFLCAECADKRRSTKKAERQALRKNASGTRRPRKKKKQKEIFR